MKSQKKYIQTAPAIITQMNTDAAKLKQEIQRKHTEQEAAKAEIMRGVVENGEIIQELEVKSCEKGKTENEV